MTAVKHIMMIIAAILFIGCSKEVANTPTVDTTNDNCIIYYTSTDGNIVEPSHIQAFEGLKIISNDYENGVGTITFSDDITTIGWCAFQGCTTLASIKLPESVTTIKGKAFQGCIQGRGI